MMKLAYAPEHDKRENTPKWSNEVSHFQNRLHRLIEDNPGLRAHYTPDLLDKSHVEAHRALADSFPGNRFPKDRKFARYEILKPETEQLFR